MKTTRSAIRAIVLVQLPGVVAEFTGKGVVRDDAESDLVGDEDDGAASPGSAPARRAVSAAISHPASIRFESHSVRQSTSTGRSGRAASASPAREIARLLDGQPGDATGLGCAPFAMRRMRAAISASSACAVAR